MKSVSAFLIVSIMFFLFVSISFSPVSAQSTNSENYSVETIHSSGGTETSSSEYDTKTVAGTITGKASSLDYGTSLGFFSGITEKNRAPSNPDTKLRSTYETNYSNENLECYSSISDPDGDNLDAYVRWYKNGELFEERSYENGYSSGYDFEALLNSDETSAGDVWKCGLRIYDGEKFSDWVNSSDLTVREVPVEEEPSEPGGGGAAPEENVTEEGEFEVEPGLLQINIKQGSALRENFKVINTGNTSLDIDLSKKDLEFLRAFDENSFSLERNETKEVSADFYVEEETSPDVYSGKIDVKGNNNQTETISVIVVVEEREPLFDVITHIEDKRVNPGRDVTGDIQLINMGDLHNFDVLLTYSIRDLEGNTITFREESLAIDEELNLTRSLEVPNDAEEGQYIFHAHVRYDDVTASGTETFRVIDPTIPLIAYYLISLILLVLIIILIIIIYRKYREYQIRRKVLKEEGIIE